MKNKFIAKVEEAGLKKELPEFEIGDQVEVHQKILEGEKERTQVFSGLVISRKGEGMREMFTVPPRRAIGRGRADFPPELAEDRQDRGEAAPGKVRQALKLYYLRDRVGKDATRLRERKKKVKVDVRARREAPPTRCCRPTGGRPTKEFQAEPELLSEGPALAWRSGSDSQHGLRTACNSPGRPSLVAAAGSGSLARNEPPPVYVCRLGYSLLEHNFYCELGEIDIIALDGKTIVFVEVRSTEEKSPTPPFPLMRVESAGKHERSTRLALYFLQKRRLLDCAARFDVLAISWPASQAEPTIVHYPNAFEATDRFQPYS